MPEPKNKGASSARMIFRDNTEPFLFPQAPDWLGSLDDFDTCPRLDAEERWAIRGIALVRGPYNPDDTHPQAALASACWWWDEHVEDPAIFGFEDWDEDELLMDFSRFVMAHPKLAKVVSERAARLDGDDLEHALAVSLPPRADTRLVNVVLADGSRRLMHYPVRCGQCGEWREDKTEHLASAFRGRNAFWGSDLDDPEEQEEALTRPGHTTCDRCWEDLGGLPFKAAH